MLEQQKLDKSGVILVVDDDDDNRDVVTTILREHIDCPNVVAVKDGQEAIEFLFLAEGEVQPPALIITDLRMPRVDGGQLIEMIRARRDHCRYDIASLPIILMTGTPGDVLPIGFNHLILKPLDIERFTRAVKSLLPYQVS